MGIEPNLHPVFVHFTVALVIIATLCALASKVLKGALAEQSVIVARWTFIIAAVITVFTVAAGIFAFNTVNHDDASHEVMLEHRNLAMVTFALIVVAAVLFYMKRKEAVITMLILLFSVAASGMVVSTAWHGGELVYHFGLGVKSLPKPHSDHSHSHGDASDAEHSHSDAEAEHAHSENISEPEHTHSEDAGEHSHEHAETEHSHADSIANPEEMQSQAASPEQHDHHQSDAQHSHDEPGQTPAQ